MNIFKNIWHWWKSRHRHAYATNSVLACEKWLSPSYLTRRRCNCGRTYYVLSTVLGEDKVDQTWAKNFFKELYPSEDP